MSRRYQVTATAQQGIDEIGAFIAEDSVDAALKVCDALEEAFELLAENRGIGHTREDLTDRSLKFWSVFSYLGVYDPSSRPLSIVAVLHGALDVEQLLRKPER